MSKKTIEVNPNIENFIHSLRDIGYSFEIAVADVLDNSITANSEQIDINMSMSMDHQIKFELIDNGYGMSNCELIEAMRLASKNPLAERSNKDLGRFGLGLKTASFSQCKKLTVFSKKNGTLSGHQWDLDYVTKENKWLLIKIEEINYKDYYYLEKLDRQESGTLVIWENIDRINKTNFVEIIDKLRKHLALVFHRFLENEYKKISFTLNNNEIQGFNPFNIYNSATQEFDSEKIYIGGDTIIIRPFILPHPSKISQQEFEQFATEDGYTKSQGFYLYRANRLLIHGTWFGLHKIGDAHKLVRIQIDIPNNRDSDWGIDVKKSVAKPIEEIKKDLKRIIKNVTAKGSRLYTGRGKKINEPGVERYWNQVADKNGQIVFQINKNNKVLEGFSKTLSTHQKEIFDFLIESFQNYIPFDSILAELQRNPYEVIQSRGKSEKEKKDIRGHLRLLGLSDDYINTLEDFKN